VRKKIVPIRGTKKRKFRPIPKHLPPVKTLGAPRPLVGGGVGELVRHFLSNRAATTLKAYRADLDSFAGFLEKHSSEEAIAELLEGGSGNANLIALRWLGQMRDDELASSTRARRISTLRSVVVLARMLGMVTWEIEIKPPKFQRTSHTVPEVSDLQCLLRACGDGLLGTRDKALLLIALTMGLHRSELATLTLGDYDHAQSRLLIHGKGGRKSWMKVPPRTAEALNAWICLSRGEFCSTTSPPLRADPKSPIFFRLDRTLSEECASMTPDGIYIVIRRLGKRAGIRVSPHDLRNASLAAALKATNGNIRAVQRFGRFSDPNSVLPHDERRIDAAGTISESVAALTDGRK